MHRRIEKCRICKNPNLIEVLDLGIQTLTGVFPASTDQKITSGPLKLVKCTGSGDHCGLLQLSHSYDMDEMYGDNYGYRSGLNQSMVRHLHGKVHQILETVDFSGKPIVLDIGSNDGTTLNAYPNGSCMRIGMDPTIEKFREFYPEGVTAVAGFFTAAGFQNLVPGRKARVVTSFSMFYDLEQPMEFMREVASILEDNGLWVFEQSYMPMMLDSNSYDTVCHEHLEYYALRQIKWMTDRVGFKIVDVEFNDVNGGSFSVAVAKQEAAYPEYPHLQTLLDKETELGLDTLVPYRAFAERALSSRTALRKFIKQALSDGKRIAGLGASTKGNVLLQYCGLGPHELFAIGEVNPYKYGRFTPGSLIQIVPEDELFANKPDYLIVLPWHFRTFFIEKYSQRGVKLVFPLPFLEID